MVYGKDTLQFDKTTFMKVAINNNVYISLNVGYGSEVMGQVIVHWSANW
jgi:hypothetical protein